MESGHNSAGAGKGVCALRQTRANEGELCVSMFLKSFTRKSSYALQP
jgi:hypothetical protein